MSSRKNSGSKSSSVRNDLGTALSNDRWESIDDPGEFGPGCSVPIIIGESERSYYFPFGNHERWQPETLTKTQQECLLKNMMPVLLGLHELHQRRLFYGRISRDTFCQRGDVAARKPLVHVDPRLVSSSADVTGGHREEKYWHHDRIRKPREAKATDDLYSLGVVLAEVLLQPDHVDRIWSGLPDKSDFPEMLIRDLKQSKKTNRHLKKLVYRLLRSPDYPKRTAEDAVAFLRQQRVWKRIGIAAGIATCSFIVAAVLLWVGRGKFATLNNKIESLNLQLVDAKEDVKHRDEKIKKLTLPGPIEPPKSIAEKTWNEEIAGGTVDEVIAEAKKYLNGNPLEKVAKQIKEWHEGLEMLKDNSPYINEWYQQDDVLNEALRSTTHRPWEGSNAANVRVRVRALNSAYETWSGWAKSTKTFNDLVTKDLPLKYGVEREILGDWLSDWGDVYREGSTLTFQITGKTSNAIQTQHLMTIDAGETSAFKEWEWATENESGGSIIMNLMDYKIDQPIEIWLEQDGIAYNLDVIHFTYGGPLAPWKVLLISNDIPLVNKKNGYSIHFRLATDVGPPHLSKITKPIVTPDDSEPTSSNNQATNPNDDKAPPVFDPGKRTHEFFDQK